MLKCLHILSCLTAMITLKRKVGRSVYLSLITLSSEYFWKFCALLLALSSRTDAAVVVLGSNNMESVLAENNVVFVNFYADWCRFSQHLKPIFEEASNKFNTSLGPAVFGSVDCDRQPDIAQKYHVSKYPTLKLFRFGELIKKEYRGQRSGDALAEFVSKQMKSNLQAFTSKEDLDSRVDNSKRNVIVYFGQSMGIDFKNIEKAASALRDDCVFWIGQGDWVLATIPNGNAVFFKDANNANNELQYSGPLDDYKYLSKWLSDKCIPLVREITFENAEELTEEGVPFLILFRSVGDSTAEKLYSDAVLSELYDQRTAINCLMADGKRFAHPLHHLGKSEKDLPLIAIDSFRHMYLFPDFSKLGVKGELRQFVMNLHSGKLHREFHHGPDPTVNNQLNHNSPDGTQPPESVFKQLKPSENRYSILNKEEL